MDQIEQEIQAKGLTAPRVTPTDVEANIASEHYAVASDMFGVGVHEAHPMEIAARIEAPNIFHTRPEGELHRAAGAMLREMAAEIERLRTLLARVADEPNIDKARALADAELYQKPNDIG